MSKVSAPELLRSVAAFAEKIAAAGSRESALAAALDAAKCLGARDAEVWLGGEGSLELGAGTASEPNAAKAVAASQKRLVVGELVAVPLLAGSDLEGVLVAKIESEAGISEGQLQALAAIATGLALFLGRRRLHAAERQLAQRRKEHMIIFDSVPAMIWFKDDRNRILRCNRPAAQQRGLTPEAMEGRRTEEFYPDEAAQYLEDDLEVIRSERPKLGIVELHMTGSGEKIWVSTDKIPYRDETGKVVGVIVFATDITHAKRAEEALRAEKERLRATLASCAEAVIATDVAGCVTLLNPVAEKLLGWTLSEAEGRPLHEVLTIEPEGPGAIALRPRRGERRIVEESRAPIKAGDTVAGEVIALRDVTDTKRLEAELLKAAKMESIGLLAAGIAHDFNNILTAVAANASLARASVGAASPALPLLDEVERASRQARDLTLQLLTFAKGGAPALERCSIEEIVRESAAFALHGSNVLLHVAIPPGLEAVDADRGQMGQVIQNLVINSKQAMPAGGTIAIEGENVSLSAREALALRVPEGRYVKLSVSDTGTGIARENLLRIFDPFFTTKPGGSGLGLTTTYSIVRRHEGAITCDSKLGAWTRFDIFLPTSRRPVPAKPPAPAEPAAREESFSGWRALVMDDQKTVREVLGRMLDHLGIEVAFACEGAEAVRLYGEALSHKRFHVVFMDLTVPGGMGGKDAVERILALDPRACAVVSSGYSNDPVMADHMRYGFAELLAKPFLLEDVARVLARLAQRVRSHSG